LVLKDTVAIPSEPEKEEDKGLVHRVMLELVQLNQSGTLPVD
jgi:hypothetical protein